MATPDPPHRFRPRAAGSARLVCPALRGSAARGLRETPDASPVLLDRHGTPILHLTLPDSTRSRPVVADEIPADLIACTLAAEDKRFYAHGGVDPLATLAGGPRFLGEAADRLRRVHHHPAADQNHLAARRPQSAHENPRGARRPPTGNDLVEAPDPHRLPEPPRLRKPPDRRRRSRAILFPKTPRRPLARRVRPARRAPAIPVPPQSHPPSPTGDRPPEHRAQTPRRGRKSRRQPASPPRSPSRLPCARSVESKPAPWLVSDLKSQISNPNHPRPPAPARPRSDRPRGNRPAQGRQPPPRRRRRHSQPHRGNPRPRFLRRLGRPARRPVQRRPHPALARLHAQALHLPARHGAEPPHPVLHPRRHPHPVPHAARPRPAGKLRPHLPRPGHAAHRARLFAERPRPPRTQLPRRPATASRACWKTSGSPPSARIPPSTASDSRSETPPSACSSSPTPTPPSPAKAAISPQFSSLQRPMLDVRCSTFATPGSSPTSYPTPPPAHPRSSPEARSIFRSAAP